MKHIKVSFLNVILFPGIFLLTFVHGADEPISSGLTKSASHSARMNKMPVLPVVEGKSIIEDTEKELLQILSACTPFTDAISELVRDYCTKRTEYLTNLTLNAWSGVGTYGYGRKAENFVFSIEDIVIEVQKRPPVIKNRKSGIHRKYEDKGFIIATVYNREIYAIMDNSSFVIINPENLEIIKTIIVRKQDGPLIDFIEGGFTKCSALAIASPQLAFVGCYRGARDMGTYGGLGGGFDPFIHVIDLTKGSAETVILGKRNVYILNQKFSDPRISFSNLSYFLSEDNRLKTLTNNRLLSDTMVPIPNEERDNKEWHYIFSANLLFLTSHRVMHGPSNLGGFKTYQARLGEFLNIWIFRPISSFLDIDM